MELKGLYSGYSLFRLEFIQLLEKIQSKERYIPFLTETQNPYLLSPCMLSSPPNKNCKTDMNLFCLDCRERNTTSLCCLTPT